jgi:hypothetical protein
MQVCPALLIAVLIVATPLCASAQIEGEQSELLGGPWTPPPAQPPVPPPACRQLLALRDEVQKHSMAIQKANERKATVQEACKLFRTFLATEAKLIRGLEDNSRTCGVPLDAIKLARDGHAKASQIGKQVCDAAAQGPRPIGPTGDFGALGEFEQKSDHSRHYEDGCRDCGKTGDFWWPGDRMPGR